MPALYLSHCRLAGAQPRVAVSAAASARASRAHGRVSVKATSNAAPTVQGCWHLRYAIRSCCSFSGWGHRDLGTAAYSLAVSAARHLGEYEALGGGRTTPPSEPKDEPIELAGPSSVAAPLPEALTATFSTRFPTMSSARKACRKKLVRISVAGKEDGEWKQGKCIDQVEVGQPIEVLVRDYQPSQRSSVRVDVVYEDDHMAVIDKPPGFMIHGRGRKTIKHILGGSLAPSSEPEALPRPHPVHRLDKLTGGLLVCAKTRAAAVNLSKAFEERRVSKTYHALVAGALPPSGEVDAELDGKSAFTRYRVLTRSRSLRFYGHISLVELKPQTGRKHQLRKHMSMLGHPIIGDGLYSDQDDEQLRLQHQGLFLWATELEIEHPVSTSVMHFQINAPKKFQQFSSAQQGRWEKLGQEKVDGGESPAKTGEW